jgi:hypothetical protein
MATSWSDYYVANEADGGYLQALCEKGHNDLADLAKGLLGDPDKFARTLSSSGGSNVIMVPSGNTDEVRFLHQGVPTSSHLGGDQILMFAYGNLSESPFKDLDADEAVSPIYPASVTRNRGIGKGCPKLGSLVSATSGTAFKALPAEGDPILEGRPVHLWVHPAIFLGLGCPQRASASNLAASLTNPIQAAESEHPPPSTQELQELTTAKEELHVVLAYLWAVSHNLVKSVALEDLPESPQLNHQCEQIRGKVRSGGNPGTPTQGAPLPSTTGELTALTAVAQTLMTTMSNAEVARARDRTEDRASKSLIKSLGPTQQGLFLTLATDDLRDAPTQSAFMKSVLGVRSPTAAVNRILSEMRSWQGGVSVSGLHRFFANGFMSQENNAADVGGLSIFLCFPKTRDSGPVAFNQDRAQLREHLDLDTDEATLNFYLKKEFTVAKDVHELQIQIETFRNLLELLTCHDSVVTQGLSVIIRDFKKHYTMIQEMFVTVPQFGLKFLYSLDRHVQRFLEQVSSLKVVAAAHHSLRRFLIQKAEALLEGIADGIAPSIMLPASLAKPKTGKPSPMGDSTSGPADRTKDKEKDKAEKAKEKLAPKGPVQNPEVHPAWAMPSGSTYEGLFQAPSPNLGGWPIIKDPRHKRPKPLCIRYQALGKCQANCYLGHIQRTQMSPTDASAADALFKTAYTK